MVVEQVCCEVDRDIVGHGENNERVLRRIYKMKTMMVVEE